MLDDKLSEAHNLFNYAVTRKPGRNIAQGISSHPDQVVDYQKAITQHAAYVQGLKDLGLNVEVLEADERYPDCCFVEDTAIVTEKGTMITNPGDPRRAGEEGAIEARIRAIKGPGEDIRKIIPPGTLDGGDVLRIKDRFYIGVSKRKAGPDFTPRTNAEGAGQLKRFLESKGFKASILEVDDMLHLKTGVTYAGRDTIVGVKSLIHRPEFDAYTKIEVPDKEATAANLVSINGVVLMHAGNPITESRLRTYGFDVRPMQLSEFEKLDGGATCLSIPMQGKERLQGFPRGAYQKGSNS